MIAKAMLAPLQSTCRTLLHQSLYFIPGHATKGVWRALGSIICANVKDRKSFECMTVAENY